MSPVDLNRPWRLHPKVSVRPEPFGALLYHFGNRKLSFLKDRTLLAAVQALGEHPTAREALAAAGVADDDVARYAAALGTLAASDMVVDRTETAHESASAPEVA